MVNIILHHQEKGKEKDNSLLSPIKIIMMIVVVVDICDATKVRTSPVLVPNSSLY